MKITDNSQRAIVAQLLINVALIDGEMHPSERVIIQKYMNLNLISAYEMEVVSNYSNKSLLLKLDKETLQRINYLLVELIAADNVVHREEARFLEAMLRDLK